MKLATGLGGTKICFEALRKGDIDVYPEYTGTGLFAILEGTPASAGPDAQTVYDHVKREFASRFALEWLPPFGFSNSYALIARADMLEREGVHSTSELLERWNAKNP